ncbi:MAG: 50S ribosomal protein L18 [Candidatus Shikimatogenerans bostrichidophilus]|nr:MAG: 50S ribosomal protein L18 [Candidatus Shikimatogenerans bostrichidophilus]
MNNKKKGTSLFPRISIFRSNKYIYVQIIDDIKRNTIISYSSLKIRNKKITKIEYSKIVGKKIAKKMLKINIKKAFFDRNKYKYHGRIKILIENIRKGGIEI